MQDQYSRSEVKPEQRSLSAVHRESSDGIEGTWMTFIQAAFLGSPKATRDRSSDNGSLSSRLPYWQQDLHICQGELSLEASESPAGCSQSMEQAAFRCPDGPTTSTAWIEPPFPVPPLVHFLLPFPTLIWEFLDLKV